MVRDHAMECVVYMGLKRVDQSCSKNYVVWLGSLVLELGRDKQMVGLYGTAYQVSSSVVKVIGTVVMSAVMGLRARV